jgi:ribosome-binding protein aMBF1 (putative translation factor)
LVRIAPDVSGDGNTIAVCAQLENGGSKGINGNQADLSAADSGAIYLFTRTGTTWVWKAHETLAPEFELARTMLRARVRPGLTQEQLAERMDTSQSVIARLESGRVRPSSQTLGRLAAATGSRLKIPFERLSSRE